MNDFRESDHPRGQAHNAGQFRGKTNSAPAAPLTEASKAGRPLHGASLSPASFGGYTLKKVKNTVGSEGDGFVAELHHDGRLVGEVFQYGDGGGTWARFRDRSARESFESFVSSEWSDEIGDDYPAAYHQEVVLDAIYGEHQAAKELRRRYRRGDLPVLTATQLKQAVDAKSVEVYGSYGKSVGEHDEVFRESNGALAGGMYFDGEDWQPFEREAPGPA